MVHGFSESFWVYHQYKPLAESERSNFDLSVPGTCVCSGVAEVVEVFLVEQLSLLPVLLENLSMDRVLLEASTVVENLPEEDFQ